jgi:hypothetical protein
MSELCPYHPDLLFSRQAPRRLRACDKMLSEEMAADERFGTPQTIPTCIRIQMERADAAEAEAKAKAEALNEVPGPCQSWAGSLLNFPRAVAYRVVQGAAIWVEREVTRLLSLRDGWELHGDPMPLGASIAQALVRYAEEEPTQ